jgi:adenosylcobyric acid synthase
MFVGTGSDVGKSVINTAFCRIFLQDGFYPAPFKAQNMSLNSFATPDGLEIGRAQAVQAEACGIACSVEMNPVLLKPSGDMTSQVVLNGKPAGTKSASEYFSDPNRDALFNEVMKSYYKLATKYNPVVIEGAGSISEMNLWDKDITNMRVAEAVGASTFLVADIDRGGVFASVFGSIHLLPPKWRKLIKGIIINKFRGDIRLFEDAKITLQQLTGVPVVGVIPWFNNIHIEQEDSVVLDRINKLPASDKINIAVVQLRHMSNFTDFDALQQINDVNLYFTSRADDLIQADIVIIPGSKNVIADMQFLNKNSLSKVILQMHNKNVPLFGICGGYQIMGTSIADPHGVEGNIPIINGLGILPVNTILTAEKKTERCHFSFIHQNDCNGDGYEIHMGVTNATPASPLCLLSDGYTDGYYKNSKTWGTYIHGIFDNQNVIENILKQANSNIKVDINYRKLKETAYNQLADLVRQNTDMKYIYKCLTPES